MFHLKKTTRIEVIDDNGRQFVRKGIKRVEISMRDKQKTMKIFLSNKLKKKKKKTDYEELTDWLYDKHLDIYESYFNGE